jgi:hypothetical protein
MITAAEDPALRQQWIGVRREINAAIIKAAGNYRAVPTVSVGRLTDIVRAAVQRGGVVAGIADLSIGNEVLFIRGNYSAMGIVQMVRNQLTFVAPSGIKLPIDSDTDVLFRFPAGGFYGEQLAEGVQEKQPCDIHEQKEKLNNGFIFKLLHRDKELMGAWVALYDQAVKGNSIIPVHLAWIRFKEVYAENPVTGEWFEHGAAISEA